MSGDWKPGDVALVNGQVCIQTDGGWEHGNPRAFNYADSPTLDIRPLAVIDPEDTEQRERLWRLFAVVNTRDDLAAALREFATPTPPKPDEPLGLGAVVETETGRRYVRTYGSANLPDYECWKADILTGRCRYSDIPQPVRVLSEGVTTDQPGG